MIGRRVLPAVFALVPTAATAHVPYEDPWAWTFDPWGLVPLGFAAMVYAIGLSRQWARAGVGRGTPRHRAALFAGGLVTAALAVASPIDALADALLPRCTWSNTSS